MDDTFFASHLRDLLFPRKAPFLFGLLLLLLLLQSQPEQRLELRDQVVVDRVGAGVVELAEVEVGVDVGVRCVEGRRLRVVPVRQARVRRGGRCSGGFCVRRLGGGDRVLDCYEEVFSFLE